MHNGIGVSPGVVVGVAYRVESVLGLSEPKTLESPALVPAEIAHFDRAVEDAESELEGLVQRVAQELGPSAAEIFQTHLQILGDPGLLSRVHSLIEQQYLTALSALHQVMNSYAAQFARIEQDYFRERLNDLRDVILRVGSHLTRKKEPVANGAVESHDGEEPVILVAHEILPSQAMSLGDLPIAGIVTEVGGSTSHAAILARSRGIPAVSGVDGILNDVASGDLMVVDGREGHVLVRPDQEATMAYRKVQREFFHLKDSLVSNREEPARSLDGTRAELLANINNLADAHSANTVGASGVGLFRTEYLFLTHHDVPGEEEQYEYYKQIVLNSPDQTVTIRTLDLGGDKTVPYLGRRSEPNPFMGWRSIRIFFENPKLLITQIRAILRAGRHGKVSMLFPMVTTLEELRRINKMVKETRDNLRREGVTFAEDVKTGVMVEVPCRRLLHRRPAARDRLHLDRLQRPDPVSRGGRSRQSEGCPPLRAAEPGDFPGFADGARRLRANRNSRDLVRRDGRSAALGSGALRYGPAPVQHEPGLRPHDQEPAGGGHDRAGGAFCPPRAAALDQR